MKVMEALKALLTQKKPMRGQMNLLMSAIISFVSIGFLLGIAFLALGGFQNGTDNTSNAYSGIGSVISGLTVFSGQMSTIAWVVIGAVLMAFVGLFAAGYVMGGKR